MPNDYVNLKNLQGVEIKPITDLAAINLTEVNGIAVEGNTIGIQDGYIESAYYTEMVDPTVGPAASSSAYVEGGTIYTLLGGYAVTSAINTASPSQQKVPSEAAVVSAFDDIVVSGASYYAGTGINIDAGHTVSVANVPTSAVAGLDTQLTGISASVAGKQDAISAGYRMELSGTTLSQARYFPIESPTSATITLQAGHAYKIQATAGSKTLTAETIPANQFGLEGHAEIFIANTGLIKTTSSVVLSDPLEPDAVNNCTVRFHDGLAIISVEDHVAGYIVTVNAASGAGSLNYGLATSTNEYIAVDASLNGSTLDLGGAVTNGEKHVVGNGYTETIVSGGINCTSKTTFANLGMDGVIVSSGTLTLGDVYIPNGATVAVSGGGLAVEKVSGNGGTIDLGGTNVSVSSGTTASASGCTFSGGSAANGGAMIAPYGNVFLSNCVISGNIASNAGGGINSYAGNIHLTSTTIRGNTNSGNDYYAGKDGYFQSARVYVEDSIVGIFSVFNASIELKGSNSAEAIIGVGGQVYVSSGAIVDMTGATGYNGNLIDPGNGVTFEEGGATVYPSAGQASAYMLGGMTVPQIGNTNVVYLNGGYIRTGSDRIIYASGCQFVSGTTSNMGSIDVANSATIVDCTVTNSNRAMRVFAESGTASATIIGGSYDAIGIGNGVVTLGGNIGLKSIFNVDSSFPGSVTISSGASINLTSSINPGGTGGITVLTGGCTVNGNAIPAGTYTSIDSNGTPT